MKVPSLELFRTKIDEAKADLDSLGNASSKGWSNRVRLGDGDLVTSDAVYKAVIYGKQLEGTLSIPYLLGSANRVHYSPIKAQYVYDVSGYSGDQTNTVKVNQTTINFNREITKYTSLESPSRLSREESFSVHRMNWNSISFSGVGSGRVYIETRFKFGGDFQHNLKTYGNGGSQYIEVTIKQGRVTNQTIYTGYSYDTVLSDGYWSSGFRDYPMWIGGVGSISISSLV